VVVPTDGSAVSKRAVDEGAAIAAERGATLHLLTVIDPSVFGGDDYAAMPTDVFEERAESILDRAVERAKPRVPTTSSGRRSSGTHGGRSVGTRATRKSTWSSWALTDAAASTGSSWGASPREPSGPRRYRS